MTLRGAIAKRTFDVALASAGLLTLAPALVVLAAAVKIDSRGPALYGHWRAGRRWSPFRVWKFRTMVAEADSKGPSVTASGDARITRLGRHLRATKLDELPQLWNVIIGDMSLVGPRPEAIRYAALFRHDYDQILEVRPGITDEAAIRYRDEESLLGLSMDPERTYVEQVLPRKIALYHDYIQNQSLATDIIIIARTLVRILRK